MTEPIIQWTSPNPRPENDQYVNYSPSSPKTGCGLKAAGGIEKVLEAVAGRFDLGRKQTLSRVLEAVGGAVRVADAGEMVFERKAARCYLPK